MNVLIFMGCICWVLVIAIILLGAGSVVWVILTKGLEWLGVNEVLAIVVSGTIAMVPMLFAVVVFAIRLIQHCPIWEAAK